MIYILEINMERKNYIIQFCIRIYKYLYLMQFAKQSTKLNYDVYTFNIVAFTDKKIGLNIVDTYKNQIYEQKQIIFEKITVKTLIEALKKTRKQLKLKIGELNCQNQIILEIEILISHQLLPTFSQKIYCKKTKSLTEIQCMKKKISDFSTKIQQIRSNLLKDQQRLFVNEKLNAISNSSNAADTNIVSLKLKPGLYVITASFFVQASNQWIYIGLANQKAKFIDHQGFYVSPQTKTAYSPVILRATHEVTQQQDVTLVTFSGTSYPATLYNTILTAQRI